MSRGADVDHHVRQIAEGLQEKLTAVTETLQRQLQTEIPGLGHDAQSVELWGSSVRGNVDTVLHAMRYGIDVRRIQAPTTALENARRVAQRGVPVHQLVRAYRVGQQRMNELVFTEVQKADMEPVLKVAVLEKISAIMFAYIDWMSQQVVEVYEDERERWLETQSSLRALRVREILNAAAPVDADESSATIRYPLRWHHLAVVMWYPRGTGDHPYLPRLQRFLAEIGQAAGVGAKPLFVAADAHCGWGWLPFRANDPDGADTVRRFALADADAPSVGIGSMAAGVDGFRRSHRQANAAAAVAAARDPQRPNVLSFDDPGVSVAALLGDDIPRAREWVGEVLGDLATDSASDERLRETLSVFLSTGSSYKTAADLLNLHPNSVKYRIGRAVDRLGRALGPNRLDVELALLLCHWYGDSITRQPRD